MPEKSSIYKIPLKHNSFRIYQLPFKLFPYFFFFSQNIIQSILKSQCFSFFFFSTMQQMHKRLFFFKLCTFGNYIVKKQTTNLETGSNYTSTNKLIEIYTNSKYRKTESLGKN